MVDAEAGNEGGFPLGEGSELFFGMIDEET